MSITLQYGVSFGRGDSSDWIEYEVRMTKEQSEAYQRDWMLHRPLDEDPLLADIPESVRHDIEQEEISNYLCYNEDDDYIRESLGLVPVDELDLEDLVHDHDPYTIKYLGLKNLTDEELDEWESWELNEVPNVCDFYEDFEPTNPFEEGWSLYIDFAEHPEEQDIDEEELRNTLTILFRECNGEFGEIHEYLERCGELYVGKSDLGEVVKQIAGECGFPEFDFSEE